MVGALRAAESAVGQAGVKNNHLLLIQMALCSKAIDRSASKFGLNPQDRMKLKAELPQVKSKLMQRDRTKDEAS